MVFVGEAIGESVVVVVVVVASAAVLAACVLSRDARSERTCVWERCSSASEARVMNAWLGVDSRE